MHSWVEGDLREPRLDHGQGVPNHPEACVAWPMEKVRPLVPHLVETNIPPGIIIRRCHPARGRGREVRLPADSAGTLRHMPERGLWWCVQKSGAHLHDASVCSRCSEGLEDRERLRQRKRCAGAGFPAAFAALPPPPPPLPDSALFPLSFITGTSTSDPSPLPLGSHHRGLLSSICKCDSE